MRLLVTGGAGFIGSNFAHYILARYPDYHVRIIDKLTYAGNLENLASLRGNPRFEFVHGDICDAALADTVTPRGTDAVLNFAAESHVDRSILDPSEFARTNIMGTLSLLEAGRKNKVGRFVQISTDEVYGSLGPTGTFTEGSPLRPNSPYAASKAAADLLVRSYHRTYAFPGVVTRCSNNYGPFQFPEKLIPLLIANAMADLPLPMYGDGMHVRDWIHVRDHCAAVERVLHQGRPGEVYNIGARRETPNLEIARLILRLLDKPDSLISYVKDRPGHDRRYAIDASRIERELGWRARHDFGSGIVETVRWYLQNPRWVQDMKSGAYKSWLDTNYAAR